ncbi:MAG: hypothetical protein LKG20_06805 [Tetrasphaera jenkinsii]|nr:hypothetical protein [Tetrasphaera jenkinsii]
MIRYAGYFGSSRDTRCVATSFSLTERSPVVGQTLAIDSTARAQAKLEVPVPIG